jgi:hypothetical protein
MGAISLPLLQPLYQPTSWRSAGAIADPHKTLGVTGRPRKFNLNQPVIVPFWYWLEEVLVEAGGITFLP